MLPESRPCTNSLPLSSSYLISSSAASSITFISGVPPRTEGEDTRVSTNHYCDIPSANELSLGPEPCVQTRASKSACHAKQKTTTTKSGRSLRHKRAITPSYPSSPCFITLRTGKSGSSSKRHTSKAKREKNIRSSKVPPLAYSPTNSSKTVTVEPSKGTKDLKHCRRNQASSVSGKVHYEDSFISTGHHSFEQKTVPTSSTSLSSRLFIEVRNPAPTSLSHHFSQKQRQRINIKKENLLPSAEEARVTILHHPSSVNPMGGCVTKSAAATLSDCSVLPDIETPENGKLQRSERRNCTESTDMNLMNGYHPGAALASPCSSTRPTDGGSTGSSPIDKSCDLSQKASLKHRERRRLSLSQSDPVRANTKSDDFRGQFLINQGQTGVPPESSVRLNQSQLEQLSTTAAATLGDPTSEADDNGMDSPRSDDDDGSLPSSDEEAERRQAEEARCAATTGGSVSLLSSVSALLPQRECRRLSVSGMPSSMKQDNFENKRQEVKSDTGFFDSNTLLALGIGYACKKGLKPESPNQDDFFIVRIDDWGLYGVFDGHGPYGHDVSNFVQRELPKLIYNDASFLSNPKAALKQSFLTIHQMLEVAAATHNVFDCSLSGSTATVVLHRKTSKKLYIAHVGDSRCVLGRLSKNGRKVEAVDLTVDHKPNTECERKRILASGGQVRRLEGDIPYRVFLKGRLYPGLAMSRAIGDTVGTQAGVICEPDVTEYTINCDRDLFIVLCSDGVWEFLSSSDVAEVVFTNGVRGVQTSADIIARESWNRWIEEEGNVVDDITTEVIYLSPEASSQFVVTRR